YLHLCAENNIVVHSYTDEAEGVLDVTPEMPGRFSSVTLHPIVGVAEEWMLTKANELHSDAHHKCFIANSCNFPISIMPNSILATV
ncbi:MAG: OsmC family peroxiredoxin, partial [Chitinophagaceae bacterium]|nr:OsmC family peroxiredoxin [Chitinophagaceae bacterium]